MPAECSNASPVPATVPSQAGKLLRRYRWMTPMSSAEGDDEDLGGLFVMNTRQVLGLDPLEIGRVGATTPARGPP
jgi:hypothetical protein